MKKRLITFTVVCIGLLLLVSNTTVAFAQSSRLNSALEKELIEYIKQLADNNEGVEMAPDTHGLSRHSFPIKPEAKELCNQVMAFINNGGMVEIFIGWYMWVVSFDKEKNLIILTDSGR